MKTAVLALLIAGACFGETLDDQGVLELFRKGTPAAELCRIVRSAPDARFQMTPEYLNGLTNAGLPEEVLKAMAWRALHGPASDSAASPVTTASDPTPAKTAATPAPRPSSSAPWFNPRVDVFGGYSYVSVDTNGLVGRQGANGWESSASFMVNRWVGVESDFGGYYRNAAIPQVASLAARDYSFAGGPRINYGPVFFHALVGMDRLSGTATVFQGGYYGGAYILPGQYGAGQSSLATFVGGGVQVPMHRGGRRALRVSVDYVITQHNVFDGPAFAQNNIRVSTGVVFSSAGFSSDRK